MLRLNDEDVLDEDLLAVRSAVEELISSSFPDTYWQELEAEHRHPTEFLKALKDGGWLSILIPEEYGGGGMPLRAGAVVLEAICRVGGTANHAHAQMYTMGTVLRHGSEEQKARFLPAVATGELRLQAFGVTEADAGFETTNIRTKAVRDGDEYVINGSKMFTSRFFHSDLMLLLTRTTPREEVDRKSDGMSVFLVDLREAEGAIEAHPIRTMVNHETTSLHFTDLRVPVANLIGEEGNGFKYLLSGLNAERILVASEHIGNSLWLIERAATYANERVVFDRPIGKNQGVQFPLAEAFASTTAANWVRWRAVELFESGAQPGYEATTAKLLSSHAQWEAANAAMDTFGGYGLTLEYGIERKFRESRLSLIAPISTNLALAFLGEKVLGLPRSF